ncbi:MAG: Gfo/Idh/MocA family oxidoreductase [Kiritimatiellae bacterium]|nr:Gfo/Idh/MocA family oxidoreductase [Kiritimatiellia bacterium]
MSSRMPRRLSRREFLTRSAAAAATFTIVPRYVLGGPGHTPPSELITRAVIGTGSMGRGHVTSYPKTLAVCDVDKDRLAAAVKKAGGKCDGYADFRRVLERKDIDTIHIPTPPHWHALISIAAAQAGKDIFSEKPMSHTIAEGRAVISAVRRYGRVYQINAYGRSWARNFRKLVASGLLGTPVTVRMGPEHGYNWKVRNWSGRPNLSPERVPSNLDYDMWLGPAPYKPYNRLRVHGKFRGYWDYDGGGLTDMGQHYLAPIQYFLDKDDTGPVGVEAYAPWPQHPDAVGMWGHVKFVYADGTTLIIESGEWGKKVVSGLPFLEGPKGKVWDRNGRKTDPPGLFEQVRRYPDPPPMQGFEHAVRTRDDWHGHKPNAEHGHRSCSLVNLAIIAIRTGRRIQWDPVNEQVVGDEAANRLVSVPMRAPWHL